MKIRMQFDAKLFFYLIFISCSLSSCLSTIKLTVKDGKLLGVLPLEDGVVVYREKISSPNVRKAEIFKRARRWWVDSYRSPKDVFQLVDKETGEIVGKGYNTIYRRPGGFMPLDLDYYEAISIDIQEDNYVVTVKGFRIPPYYLKKAGIVSVREVPVERYNTGSLRTIRVIFEEIDKNTQATITSLKSYISRPTY